MGTSAYVSALSSTLFRALSFIFLRIIPARPGYIVLPTLFTVYVLSFLGDIASSDPIPPTVVEQTQEIDLKVDTDEKDNTVLDVTTTPVLTVTTPPPSPTLNTVLFTLPTASFFAKFLSFLINAAIFAMVADFLVRPLFEPEADLTFSRVGAVYHDAAKIVVRYPNLESDAVRILWKQKEGTLGISFGDSSVSDEAGWMQGPLVTLSSDNDWVGVGKLDSLWASTLYEYRLAHPNGTLLPYPAEPISFRTFPDPRIPGTRFKFVASSCVVPNFPYVPMKPSTRIKGFELLHEYLYPTTPSTSSSLAGESDAVSTTASISLETETTAATPIVPEAPSVPEPMITSDAFAPGETLAAPTPEATPSILPSDSDVVDPVVPTVDASATPTDTSASAASAISSAIVEQDVPETFSDEVLKPTAPTEFLMLLGDFIYADVPYFVGDKKEEYERLYRRTYASEDFRKVYEKIPVFHIYDDHEIQNNYNGYNNDSSPFFTNASAAYSAYNGNANYDSHVGASDAVDGPQPSVNYYSFDYGDVAFFVLDTRRYRSVVDTEESKTILGDKQLVDFSIWLSKVNSTAAFKFIVSSVPVSALWNGVDGQIDTWVGAVQERRAFLELLQYVPNVILISGDRHEFAAVEHVGFGGVQEFSISPLSQFYVPYIRTFHESNGQTREVKEQVEIEEPNEEGVLEKKTMEVVKTVSEEKILEYLPHGNYKWASFEVDTTDSQKPTVVVEVTIDGKKAWEHIIVGKPVRYAGGTALGSQIAETLTGSLKGVLGSLGKLTKLFG